MVANLTDRIDAALVVIDARIFALLADTCKSARAILINCTFRLALHERVSLKARGTSALADVAGWSCNCILSTRIGIARVNRCGIWRRWPDTLDECIALIAGQARADGRMVSHVALSVSATNSGTRIIALEITACLVQRAIAVDNTLWLALNVRITIIEGWTFADALCIGLYPNLAGG